ncbi:MAG TPA: type II toxin-antitoxin system VapC family toxin [Solirubrobacterales bacterium]|nr:type II toxin-antitoxin system VapC family toxin [Solirubrobacterales bacterium]
MILDSSAVIAVVFREKPHERLEELLAEAGSVAIGAPTLFETAMVALGRMGTEGEALVERFLEDLKVKVLPFGEQHWEAATDAFIRFGKGRHPAVLNFGDCMSYATAQIAGEPLLFVGNDFARTDIAPA